jgi:hypothetical protein
VRLAFDKYECWIDRKQYVEITQSEYNTIDGQKFTPTSGELVTVMQSGNQPPFPIVLGSSLPGLNQGKLNLAGIDFQCEDGIIETHDKPQKSLICAYASLFLNAPYLWGGRSPFGIDCSGFTQITYKLAGKRLPRDAWQQAEQGQTLSFVEESEAGDLAFFDDEEGNIIHTGVLLGNGKIIHASGRVRIDAIDHFGIYRPEIRDYSHKLRIIKKIL